MTPETPYYKFDYDHGFVSMVNHNHYQSFLIDDPSNQNYSSSSSSSSSSTDTNTNTITTTTTNLNKFKTISSPIVSLPTELLSQIIIHLTIHEFYNLSITCKSLFVLFNDIHNDFDYLFENTIHNVDPLVSEYNWSVADNDIDDEYISKCNYKPNFKSKSKAISWKSIAKQYFKVSTSLNCHSKQPLNIMRTLFNNSDNNNINNSNDEIIEIKMNDLTPLNTSSSGRIIGSILDESIINYTNSTIYDEPFQLPKAKIISKFHDYKLYVLRPITIDNNNFIFNSVLDCRTVIDVKEGCIGHINSNAYGNINTTVTNENDIVEKEKKDSNLLLKYFPGLYKGSNYLTGNDRWHLGLSYVYPWKLDINNHPNFIINIGTFGSKFNWKFNKPLNLGVRKAPIICTYGDKLYCFHFKTENDGCLVCYRRSEFNENEQILKEKHQNKKQKQKQKQNENENEEDETPSILQWETSFKFNDYSYITILKMIPHKYFIFALIGLITSSTIEEHMNNSPENEIQDLRVMVFIRKNGKFIGAYDIYSDTSIFDFSKYSIDLTPTHIFLHEQQQQIDNDNDNDNNLNNYNHVVKFMKITDFLGCLNEYHFKDIISTNNYGYNLKNKSKMDDKYIPIPYGERIFEGIKRKGIDNNNNNNNGNWLSFIISTNYLYSLKTIIYNQYFIAYFWISKTDSRYLSNLNENNQENLRRPSITSLISNGNINRNNISDLGTEYWTIKQPHSNSEKNYRNININENNNQFEIQNNIENDENKLINYSIIYNMETKQIKKYKNSSSHFNKVTIFDDKLNAYSVSMDFIDNLISNKNSNNNKSMEMEIEMISEFNLRKT